MSEKLPDGWFGINDEAWNRFDRASAVVRCYCHDDWQGMVYGPPRMTQAEAEQDRLHLIAGLEGRAEDLRAVEAERDAALKELAVLKTRRAGERAEHLATIHEIGKALNAYLTVDSVTVHYGTHEIANAVRAQGKALHEARADRLRLAKELEAVRGRNTVPQLLRDSMRVTQEESIRLKADMARKDAEIAALRQRATASEAYAQHLLAALNAVSGFKGMP